MAAVSPVRNPIKPLIKPLLASSLLFALIALLVDFSGAKALLSSSSLLSSSTSSGKAIETLRATCEGDITETARLSREQLLQLLAVPERDSKTRIRQIAQAPYCQLSTLQVRAGVDAVREAYPLAFDPATILVILYENDEYAGYRFKH
ncbi:MAG: hypothetical protein AAF703_02790 [Cyanobacteria bacterium P01_D01_bin.105]